MPQILALARLQATDGLLIVTFDEAEADGADADSSACCNEQPGPNTPEPRRPDPGPGGGRIGAVAALAVHHARERSTDHALQPLLAAALDRAQLARFPYLGYAGQQGLVPLGPKALNRPGC